MITPASAVDIQFSIDYMHVFIASRLGQKQLSFVFIKGLHCVYKLQV
jgi:hypothetical protein